MKKLLTLILTLSFVLSCSSKSNSRQGATEIFYDAMYADMVKVGLSKETAAAIIKYSKDNENVPAQMPESYAMQSDNVTDKNTNILRNLTDALVYVKTSQSVFEQALVILAEKCVELLGKDPNATLSEVWVRVTKRMVNVFFIDGVPPQENPHQLKMATLLEAALIPNDKNAFNKFSEMLVEYLDQYNAMDKASQAFQETAEAAKQLDTPITETEIKEKFEDEIEETTGSPAPSISFSGTTFTEAPANNGSISTSITVTLAGCAWNKSSGTFTKNEHFSHENTLPAGLTLSFAINSLTQATLTLTGSATAHAAANSETIAFDMIFLSAFKDNIAPVATHRHNFGVTFADPVGIVSLAYSGTSFTEAATNDGSLAAPVTITLTGDTFSQSSGEFEVGTDYTLSGTAVPSGLTPVVTVTDATHASLSFTGTAAAHEATNNVAGVTITFNNAAFTGALAPTNGTQTGNYSINFNNSPLLAYSATTFVEAPANDGSIATSVDVTLTGDTFSQPSGTFSVNTHYTLSGTAVPAGLTAVVTVVDTTHATLTFTGSASSHAAAQSITGLTLTFESAAFTATAGPIDGTEDEDFAITFYDTRTLSVSENDFIESNANTGSITISSTITAGGTTFSQSSGTFSANTHYTLSGTAVPAGLTAVVTVTDATHAELTFTGTAAVHETSDSVTGIIITFNAAAFTGGLAPIDGSQAPVFTISFHDPVVLSYSPTEIPEDVANNGSISETVTVDLAGNTFSQASGAFVLDTHYTISGTALPTGLTAVVTVNSTTQAEVSFSGNAVAHAVGNSTTGTIITFLPAAFTGGLAPVDDTQFNDYDFEFISVSHLDYHTTVFLESGANDGSIDNGVTIDLIDDTFTVGGGSFTLDTHYELSGTAVPAGLTVDVQWLSSTQARVIMVGDAASHLPANDVSGITITWLDAAFTSGSAPADGTDTEDLSISFINPSIMLFEIGPPTNGDLGGRLGADATCLANKPVESTHAYVRAFISVDINDEIQDMPTLYSFSSIEAIRSKNGTLVANDWADLLDGSIADDLISAGVVSMASFWWSGSDNAGALTANHCSNWTDGISGSGDAGFTANDTNWINDMANPCNDMMQATVLCIAYD